MENQRKRGLKLLIDYVEFSFPEFQEYLEDVYEIEGTEAEVIINELKEIL